MLKYTFDSGKPALFPDLKQRVHDYFQHSHLHTAGNRKLYIKGLLQVLLAASLYIVLVFFTPPAWIAIALCVLLGLDLAVIGFNIMHEGGHQTFSKHHWVNMISAYFLNVLGGNTHYWKIKHNTNHHVYTNVEGMDSDIDVKPFMRLHAGQPLRAYHRFQHLYWVILYSISYLVWIFYEDFQKYFSGKVSVNSERRKLARREHLIFWFTKAMYVIMYMAIPILTVGWLSWLVGFLVITVVCGLAISIVFQLAHVVEGTTFHAGSVHGDNQKQEWAVHQLMSTSNFGTSSGCLHWLLGGLNFQIEHHLFPRVSHIHYPAISVFVREACAKSGVVYQEHRTMGGAIASHLVHLYKLGRAVPATTAAAKAGRAQTV